MSKLFVILVALAIFVSSNAAAGDRRPKHTIDFDHYWSLEEVKLEKLIICE